MQNISVILLVSLILILIIEGVWVIMLLSDQQRKRASWDKPVQKEAKPKSHHQANKNLTDFPNDIDEALNWLEQLAEKQNINNDK